MPILLNGSVPCHKLFLIRINIFFFFYFFIEYQISKCFSTTFCFQKGIIVHCLLFGNSIFVMRQRKKNGQIFDGIMQKYLFNIFCCFDRFELRPALHECGRIKLNWKVCKISFLIVNLIVGFR